MRVVRCVWTHQDLQRRKEPKLSYMNAFVQMQRYAIVSNELSAVMKSGRLDKWSPHINNLCQGSVAQKHG